MKKVWSVVTTVSLLTFLLPVANTSTVSATPADPFDNRAEVQPAAAPDRLLVKFVAGTVSSVRANVHAQVGGKDLGRLGQGKSSWVLVEVPLGQTAEFKSKYAKNPNVAQVELDLEMQRFSAPNDPMYGNQWHHTNIQSAQAWDVQAGSSRTIAIIDTGIDLQHEDLKASLVPGQTFVKATKSADDDNGHGTHCAGIAAGIGNNGIGIAGVDPSAKLMPIKVLNKRGSGYTSDIINGLYWATDHGADVLSMSLGGGSYSQAFQDAINYAWNKNRIIVAAAGNDGVSSKHYPAAYQNVVSVAATDPMDYKTSWSNYGADWVDVAAPGLSIYSAWHTGGYNTISGTSMATPVVAGLMALTWGHNAGASNAAVVNRVLTTADYTTGTGTQYQYGRVNSYRAVNGF